MRFLVLLLILPASCSDPVDAAKGAPEVADARRFRAQNEIVQLERQTEQHFRLHGEWPEDWEALGLRGTDPWGGEYVLQTDGDDAVIFSAGPDREIGTDDDVYGG